MSFVNCGSLLNGIGPGRGRWPQCLLTDTGTLRDDMDDADAWDSQLGTQTLNTTEYREGSGSIKIAAAAGSSAYSDSDISWQLADAGERLRIVLYLHDSPDNLDYFRVYITSSNFSSYFMAERTYGFRTGWNCIDIYPDDWSNSGGEAWTNTMTKIRLRVRSESGVTVSASFDSLTTGIEGVPGIFLTFDDGYASVYDHAFDKLSAIGERATMYLQTELAPIGAPNYLTVAQLTAMRDAGWSIANHTVEATNLTTVTEAEAETALTDAKEDLDGWGFTRASAHVAYPGGNYNETVLKAMADAGMLTGRNIQGTYYHPALNTHGDAAYMLPGKSIDQATLATLQGYVDDCVTYNRQMILYTHDLVETSPGSGELQISIFNDFCDYVQDQGVAFMTIDDLYRSLSGPVTKH